LRKQCTCKGASFVELKNSLMEVAFHIYTTKILPILHIVEWQSPFRDELGDTLDMMHKTRSFHNIKVWGGRFNDLPYFMCNRHNLVSIITSVRSSPKDYVI
jgi:hypothetical protein